jgi:hypothetical protein
MGFGCVKVQSLKRVGLGHQGNNAKKGHFFISYKSPVFCLMIF